MSGEGAAYTAIELGATGRHRGVRTRGSGPGCVAGSRVEAMVRLREARRDSPEPKYGDEPAWVDEALSEGRTLESLGMSCN